MKKRTDNSVSIVIPTYNRRHTLCKVLDSYLCQKHLKEIIFIDDCSSDGSFEYLKAKAKSYPVIKISRNSIHSGVYFSRNRGIEMASGDYILFGEDDLYLGNNYVDTLLQCMDETNSDIIAGRIVYKRKGETDTETIERCDKYNGSLINYWLMSAFYLKKTFDHQYIPFLHAISLVKSDVCRKIMFDESFHMREETDFYLRAIGMSFRIVLCPHTLCFHLPRTKDKSGGWNVGVLKYQFLATKNNNMLVDRHYKLLKKWGMKGNKFTFKLLHLLNRLRIVFIYYRY